MTRNKEEKTLSENKIQIFQSGDGSVQLDVSLQDDTVWLAQAQMMALFERDQSVISRHINNVFKEGKLERESNMQKMHIAQPVGWGEPANPN